MKNLKYLVLFFVVNISCRDSSQEKSDQSIEKTEVTKDMDTTESPKFVLQRNAITKGDTNAYRDARDYYWKENETLKDFLYTSLIMANKHHFADACYDVYAILAYPYTGESLEELDRDTRYLALYYLLLAYEKRHARAIDSVKTIFINKKVPSSGFYLLELAKSK